MRVGRSEWSQLYALDFDFSASRFSEIDRLPLLPDDDHDGYANLNDHCPKRPPVPRPLTVIDTSFSTLDAGQAHHASTVDPRIMITRLNRVLYLTLRTSEAWVTYPLPTKLNSQNVIMSSYPGDRIQYIQCAERGWILVADTYDEELTLFEVDDELKVIGRSEELSSGLPAKLSLGIEDPVYATSPAYLRCQEGKLEVSQAWMERKTQSGFQIETFETTLARFTWNLGASDPEPGSLTYLPDVTSGTLAHSFYDGKHWLSAGIDDQGILWVERWHEDLGSTGAVQLTEPDLTLVDSLLFASVGRRGELVIALLDRQGSLWVSTPHPIDRFARSPEVDEQEAPIQEDPRSWFNLYQISHSLEMIEDIQLSIDQKNTVTTFSSRVPESIFRTTFLSIINEDAPIEGALHSLTTSGADTRPLWLKVEQGAYELLWSDSISIWRSQGLTPCP